MVKFLPVIVAMGFNGFDLLTGIISAIKEHDIKSSKLRDGLFKKVGFLFCYVLAWVIDTYGAVIGFQMSVAITPIIVLYTCTTETVSIIENIHRINPDLVPDKLLELFHISNGKE